MAREVGAVFFRTGVFLRSLYSGEDVLVGMDGLGLVRTTYIRTYIHTYIHMHNIHTYMCACLALEATSCRTAPASVQRRRQFPRHSSVVSSILGPPLPTGPRQNPTAPSLQPPCARRPVAATANLEHVRAYADTADTPAVGLQVDAKACTGAMLL